jgi:hypothetical protein
MTERKEPSPATPSQYEPAQTAEWSGSETLLPGPAPDLSVHFFDHHGGDESSAEYHMLTVSIPRYCWDHETPFEIGRYVRRNSETVWNRVASGLCYAIGYTDAGLPLNGHGATPDGRHARALQGACDLLIYRALLKKELEPET